MIIYLISMYPFIFMIAKINLFYEHMVKDGKITIKTNTYRINRKYPESFINLSAINKLMQFMCVLFLFAFKGMYSDIDGFIKISSSSCIAYTVFLFLITWITHSGATLPLIDCWVLLKMQFHLKESCLIKKD